MGQRQLELLYFRLLKETAGFTETLDNSTETLLKHFLFFLPPIQGAKISFFRVEAVAKAHEPFSPFHCFFFPDFVFPPLRGKKFFTFFFFRFTVRYVSNISQRSKYKSRAKGKLTPNRPRAQKIGGKRFLLSKRHTVGCYSSAQRAFPPPIWKDEKKAFFHLTCWFCHIFRYSTFVFSLFLNSGI